jgi:class 3 adenylate cyclase
MNLMLLSSLIHRQLAAIMFTDIVGYTALMQGDEEIATNVRERHREVFQQQHELHQGKLSTQQPVPSASTQHPALKQIL